MVSPSLPCPLRPDHNFQAEVLCQPFDRVHTQSALAVHQSRELTLGDARFLGDSVASCVVRLDRTADRIDQLRHALRIPHYLPHGNYPVLVPSQASALPFAPLAPNPNPTLPKGMTCSSGRFGRG